MLGLLMWCVLRVRWFERKENVLKRKYTMMKKVLVGMILGLFPAAAFGLATASAPADVAAKPESRMAVKKIRDNFAALGNVEVWSTATWVQNGATAPSVFRREWKPAGRFLLASHAPAEAKVIEFASFDGIEFKRGQLNLVGDAWNLKVEYSKQLALLDQDKKPIFGSSLLELYNSIAGGAFGNLSLARRNVLTMAFPIRPDAMWCTKDHGHFFDKRGPAGEYHVNGNGFLEVTGKSGDDSVAVLRNVTMQVRDDLVQEIAAKAINPAATYIRTEEKIVDGKKQVRMGYNIPFNDYVGEDGKTHHGIMPRDQAEKRFGSAKAMMQADSTYTMWLGRFSHKMVLDAKTGLPKSYERIEQDGKDRPGPQKFHSEYTEVVKGGYLPSFVRMEDPNPDTREYRDILHVVLDKARANVTFSDDDFNPAKLTLASLSPPK